MSGERETCPRAKSPFTPCYILDGDLVVVETSAGTKICVGCEASIDRIRRATTETHMRKGESDG